METTNEFLTRLTLSVHDVQQRLRALGYHEVETADGIMGPRSRAAILAFRQDNALTLAPIIDTALIDALETASPRGNGGAKLGHGSGGIVSLRAE